MNFKAKMLRDDALKGKTIVVTGGGSGLGKAMTKYFLELGAKVAITSRDLDKLKTTAAELEAETGGQCLAVQCDVRHYDQVENMLQTEVYADETQTAFDILPRLIYKRRNRKAYKVHLQMYLAQHIGRDPILNRALKVNCKNIE